MTVFALTTGQTLRSFAATELRAYPGRWNVALRCLLASALVVVGSVTFGVPLLPVSLFLVFFAVQSNVVLSQLVGVVMFVGMLLAVGLLMLLLMFTLENAALRLLVIEALLFGFIFMMRAAPQAGPLFYLLGLAVACAQPYFDLPLPPDLFVRGVLWAFVAAFYPLVVCLIINTVLLPGEPLRQLQDEAHRQLGELDAVLARAAGDADAPAVRIGVTDVQTGILTARKLLRYAWMRDAGLRRQRGRHLAIADTVAALREQAVLLQQHGSAPLRDQAANVAALRGALSHLDAAIRVRGKFDLRAAEWPTAATGTPLDTMWHSLRLLAESSGMAVAARPEAMPALLADDAFTNPVYVQFALKTVLAMVIGYFILLATDWIGIETVVVTCLIVAQPSLGASNRKIKQRVLGAAMGSACALFLIVFVMPRVDTIVGLLLMVMPVLAFAAYVSAGSERTAYIGQQLMFTFALATLLTFGPTTNLGEIRNRLVGIALGIGISYVIHTLLWPEREGGALAYRMAGVIRTIARQLLAPAAAGVPDAPDTEAPWDELNETEEAITRIAVEPDWRQGEGEEEITVQRMQVLVGDARALLHAVSALGASEAAHAGDARAWRALVRLRTAVAGILQEYADGLQATSDVYHAAPRAQQERLAARLPVLGRDIEPVDLRHAATRLVHSAHYLVAARRLPGVDPGEVEIVGPLLPAA